MFYYGNCKEVKMGKTTDKIILGILFVVLLGMSGVFIAAFNANSLSGQEKTTQNVVEKISEERAIEIALDAVPGIFQEVETEIKNGKTTYVVEIKDGTLSKEVKVNLQGDVIGIKTEEDEEISPEELESIDGLITEAQAIKIALNEINGRVIEVEVEREDGKVLYSIKIKKDNEIAEVEINAETGQVLEVEWGDEDDEDD